MQQENATRWRVEGWDLNWNKNVAGDEIFKELLLMSTVRREFLILNKYIGLPNDSSIFQLFHFLFRSFEWISHLCWKSSSHRMKWIELKNEVEKVFSCQAHQLKGRVKLFHFTWFVIFSARLLCILNEIGSDDVDVVMAYTLLKMRRGRKQGKRL